MDVVDKVRKLLALAESSNPHEAALAAERAHELMLRHHLTVQHLQPESEYTRVMKPVKGLKPDPEDRYLLALLNEFFFVRAFFLGIPEVSTGICIVGLRHNVDVAVHVHRVLGRQYREGFNEWYGGSCYGKYERHAFYHGATEALRMRLRAKRNEVTAEMALVVREDPKLDTMLKEMGVEKLPAVAGQVDGRTYAAGARAGEQMRLDPAIPSDRRTDPCKTLPDLPE